MNMWPILAAPGKSSEPSQNFRVHCSICFLGADDDGSGTVTILEAYRALIASDFRPIRTVEFHWYSAEVT